MQPTERSTGENDDNRMVSERQLRRLAPILSRRICFAGQADLVGVEGAGWPYGDRRQIGADRVPPYDVSDPFDEHHSSVSSVSSVWGICGSQARNPAPSASGPRARISGRPSARPASSFPPVTQHDIGVYLMEGTASGDSTIERSNAVTAFSCRSHRVLCTSQRAVARPRSADALCIGLAGVDATQSPDHRCPIWVSPKVQCGGVYQWWYRWYRRRNGQRAQRT